MRTDRLQRLITILQSVPPEHFDIKHWKCGTAACAIGWAAQDSLFNEEGLCLERTYCGFTPTCQIDGERLEHFDAVEVFFELTNPQALNLFAGGSYPDCKATPADVIERIEQVLEEA